MGSEHSDAPNQGSAQTTVQGSGLAGQESQALLCKTCSTFTADILSLDFVTGGRWSPTGFSVHRKDTRSHCDVRDFDHGNLLEIHMSAEGGCELCSVIWDSTKWQNFSDPESISIFISVLVPMLSTGAAFEVHARPPHWIRPMDLVLCTTKGRHGCSTYWDFKKEECPLPSRLGLKRKVASRPDSEECFDLARAWLLDCATTHPHCRRPDNVPLPTRVIDVGSKDGSQEPALVIPGSACGKYATLSHCWGKSERLVTTSINLGDHLQGIPLERMARNFRDAVHITRQLNIRYLWIDSFFILQDSTEDWRVESAKMASVF